MFDKMQSDQINELATALAKAQGEMNPAIKDSKNPFFKSNYADLASVWNACREVLSKNGLAVIQGMDMKDGQSVLITTLAHSSGQWTRSLLPILNEKGNAQGLGSAITYMRRYALSAIAGVTCDEDDDGNEACTVARSGNHAAKSGNDNVTADQAEEIEYMLSQCEPSYVSNVEDYYAKNFGVNTWNTLPRNQFDKLYSNISKKMKTKAA